MQRWIKSLSTLTFLCLAQFAAAQSSWQEGVHYEVISETASERAQVKEVFSFWCPHCFTFEPIVKELKQGLPDDVSFYKAHVNFMGTASPEAQNDATKLMLAAKAIGDSERFNQVLFNAIHKDRKKIGGEADMLALYEQAGGNVEKLTKVAKSFGIRGQISKNDRATRGISSVPAFIVNEKFKATFTRDMTPESFEALIKYLLTQS